MKKMTFTVTGEQRKVIKHCLKKSKKFFSKDSANKSNLLEFICLDWLMLDDKFNKKGGKKK
jgi:hypothetical protein